MSNDSLVFEPSQPNWPYPFLQHPPFTLFSPQWLYFLGLLCLTLTVYSFAIPASYSRGNRKIEAPVIGTKGTLARASFLINARDIIQEGYDKVRRAGSLSLARQDRWLTEKKFKNGIFKVSDQDIVVLPRKYVEELRNLPDHVLSSIQANIDNFEGLHSTTSLLLEGSLHTQTIQRNLTPKLGTLVQGSVDALERVLPKEIAIDIDQDSISLPAFHLILRLVSHVSARHFVGSPMCENEEWLATALQYTDNAFKTIVFLRIFPNWLKPLVSCFLPWSYLVTSALRNACRIMVPVIEERRREEERVGDGYQKPVDFLQMMMDNASEHDGQPERLTHRLLILTLASTHTTSMAATQTLFDLCLRPEYEDILRAEVKEILGSSDGRFLKTSLTRMRKMDSFMRESQRLSPPSLLGFKRATRKDITLSDGLTLPAGAHLMMPVYPIVSDPELVTDPLKFDGLRHWKARQLPGEGNKHQFATTSNTNLHFGHGKFACPGRFFASNNIKIVLAMLLLRYDMELASHSSRPADVCLHEYVFPNPWAKIRLRKR